MAPVMPILGPLFSMGMSMMMRPKDPPKPQPPAKMPEPDGPEAIAARRRKLMEMGATKGRESTNLTGNMPTAAPTFVNTTLGS